MERLEDDFVAGTWAPSFLETTTNNEPPTKKKKSNKGTSKENKSINKPKKRGPKEKGKRYNQFFLSP